MARFKVPGGRKPGRPPKTNKTEPQHKSKFVKQRTKRRVFEEIKPQVISLRGYRDIFGNSDDEEEDFYGFRSEDLGIIAYRKLPFSTSPSPRTFAKRSKNGVPSLQPDLSWNSDKTSLPLPPTHEESPKGERRKAKDCQAENVYAKQYKKRESYERKYSPSKAIRPTEPSPKLKSTSQVKFNFAPRGGGPISEISRTGDTNDLTVPDSSKSILPTAKRKAQSLANRLLAKAKGGKSLQIRKQQQVISIKVSQPVEKPQVNNDGLQVRSRSGRVVKAKKLDYDDLITSLKCGVKKVEQTKNTSVKRTLENGDMPAPKIQRVDEVQDKTGVVQAAGTAKDVQMNAKRSRGRPKSLKPSQEKVQIYLKSQKLKAKKSHHKKQPVLVTNPGDTHPTSVEIKLEDVFHQMENEKEATMKKHEITWVKEDVVDISNSSKCTYRSKRLQKRQEKVQQSQEEAQKLVETSEIVESSGEEEDGEENTTENDSTDDESSESSSETGESSSEEQEIQNDDDWKPVSRNADAGKTTLNRTRAVSSSLKRAKKDKSKPEVEEIMSESSTDEESNKPLAMIKEELKESTSKVVTRVIRVVRKIKLKNGEIKRKVIKVIKKTKKVNNKNTCPKVPGMRRTRCKKCYSCLIKDDCGECVFCMDKPKNGGTGSMKQACSLRRCTNPQAPRSILHEDETQRQPKVQEKSPRKIKKIFKKKPAKSVTKKHKTMVIKKKKEIQLKAKHTKKQKHHTKEGEATETGLVIEKPKFMTRTRAPIADESLLVKLPWSDNASEETIWKEGYSVCYTAGVPEAIQEGCFLCGSAGHDKMFYCKVCSEPFHGFCLDEEPVDKSTWCCDNCSTCVVCGLQDKLLMCDICQRGYHVECLGPNYPTEPEGDEDVWVCGRCVKCKRCGSRTPGNNPEATWMHEFTHCYNCGTNWDQGNFCPICEKCYSDNDFDSKMMQCAQCEHWVHAICQDINADQYECLSDLPDSVSFVCKLCCDEENPKWFQELKEEMLAGFSRILDEMLKSKAYESLSTLLAKIQVDNGHPKDIIAIKEKASENRYHFIGDFCDDIQIIFNRAGKIEGLLVDPQQAKHFATLFSIFVKEVTAMFPWHKIKSFEEKTVIEEKEVVHVRTPFPINGVVGEPVCYSVWDHSYFHLRKDDVTTGRKDDVTTARKDDVTTGRKVDVTTGKKDVLVEVEKMDVDRPSHIQGNQAIPATTDTTITETKHAEPKTPQCDSVPMETEKAPSTCSDDTEMTDSPKPNPTKVLSKPNGSKKSHKSSRQEGSKSKKGNNGASNNNVPVKKMPQFTEANEELGLKSVLDTRKCQLCGYYGDDVSSHAGRLLCSGLDEWVHINCGLWSAEVFEDDDGKLQNVQTAITRGKQMRCEQCCLVGATVGCCEPRCPMNYHFMCARKAGGVFQDDKKVFCNQHAFRSDEELVLEGDQFRMDRRVFIDLSKVRTFKKGLKGADAETIQLVQGAMKIECLGRLTVSSDSKECIYPIGFKASRLYWNAFDPRRRCRYYCTIVEKPKIRVKTCAEDTSGMATTDDTVHRVIAHNVTDRHPSSTDRTKPIDLTCSESSREILNSNYETQKGLLRSSTDQKGLISPSKDSKDLHSNNTCTKAKTHEITRILSGYKQILPSRPAPLSLTPASPLSSPRKILPNIQKSVRFPSTLSIRPLDLNTNQSPLSIPQLPSTHSVLPSTHSGLPSTHSGLPSTHSGLPSTHNVLPSTHSGLPFTHSNRPLDTNPSPLSIPQRRKADPTLSGIAPPKPKKQRVEGIRDSVSAAIRDKILSQRKEKNIEKPKDCGKPVEVPKPSKVKQEAAPNVKFVITTDDGLEIEADSYKAAWKTIYDMVRASREDRLLKDVPFIGLHNVSMIGLKQESVVYMLEQLPGAHQLKHYKFKYNAPFAKHGSNGEFGLEELKENPTGCCRTEVYQRTKKYDMFAFLCSVHRTAPQLNDDTDEQDWAETNYENVKRATALDLPMAMRYRQLKENSYNKNSVAVYRSGIHGRGLYCARNIAAGELVIEYSGVLIRSTLTDKREKYYDSKGIGCYMFRVDGTNVVDATTSGNPARFINHSCECNCYSRIVTVDGKKKILIFASRSISRGEELTYDYKFPVEDEKLPCLCNSKRCRKYLN